MNEKKRKRILVMDDEAMILKMSKKMLVRLGYDAEVSKNGEEAILSYEDSMKNNQRFDAVIVDFQIPGGMGGEETLAALLKIDPSATVLLSSGYSNIPQVCNFEKYGFKGVISKPYFIKDLSEALEKVIN
jgi:DNA-binding NtrC family response regulator